MRRPLPPRSRFSQPTRKPPGKPVPWWLFTNRWAILGFIVFVGLVLSLIENVTSWRDKQAKARSTSTETLQIEQVIPKRSSP
jgi:hypothetical protein